MQKKAISKCLIPYQKMDLPAAFLSKTYDILENQEFKDIVDWNEEGDSFIVKKLDEFCEKVLPKYFKHNNFQSFVRQLNMYDFHKYKQNELNYFKHPLFKKGMRVLLNRIKRKTNNKFNTYLKDVTPYNLVRETKNNELIQEFNDIKTRQENFAKILSILSDQNQSLIQENRLLWKNLLKKKKKDSKKSLLRNYLSIQNGEYTNDEISEISDNLSSLGQNQQSFLLNKLFNDISSSPQSNQIFNSKSKEVINSVIKYLKKRKKQSKNKTLDFAKVNFFDNPGVFKNEILNEDFNFNEEEKRNGIQNNQHQFYPPLIYSNSIMNDVDSPEISQNLENNKENENIFLSPENFLNLSFDEKKDDGKLDAEPMILPEIEMIESIEA